MWSAGSGPGTNGGGSQGCPDIDDLNRWLTDCGIEITLGTGQVLASGSHRKCPHLPGLGRSADVDDLYLSAQSKEHEVSTDGQAARGLALVCRNSREPAPDDFRRKVANRTFLVRFASGQTQQTTGQRRSLQATRG